MRNDVFGRGKIVFRNAIIPDKGTTCEGKLWGIYERCISIDLGCIRSRCLFPMLRNADSAKENEDPYPGRMSLIERCNGQSASGNACKIVANAKKPFSLLLQCCKPQKHFFLVATILQAPKSTFPSLQQSCKCQKPLFPCCNNLASLKKHFFLVATMLQAFPKAFGSSCSFRRNFLAGFIPTSNSRYEGPNEILMGFLRLDKRRTGGAKRLHTITRIRFIPNRSLEHLPIRLYDLGSGGLL